MAMPMAHYRAPPATSVPIDWYPHYTSYEGTGFFTLGGVPQAYVGRYTHMPGHYIWYGGQPKTMSPWGWCYCSPRDAVDEKVWSQIITHPVLQSTSQYPSNTPFNSQLHYQGFNHSQAIAASTQNIMSHIMKDRMSMTNKSQIVQNRMSMNKLSYTTQEGAYLNKMSQRIYSNKMLQDKMIVKPRVSEVETSQPVPGIITDLLAEESSLRYHREENFSDILSSTFNVQFPADKDLEELIVIDSQLDDILNSLVKQEGLETTNEAQLTKEKSEIKEIQDTVVVEPVRQKRKSTRIKHVCEVCGQQFSCRANKTDHMRIHTGEKPFQCSYCGKKFTQRSTLSSHVRTHTGTKPYRCSECKRSFSDYSTWLKHRRLHTGEKPYTCLICKKGFAQSGNLYRHIKVHNRKANRINRKVQFG